MNTRASVAYGWGILCLAGGGSYYFAKRSINADREERAMLAEQRRQDRERARVAEGAVRDAKFNSSEGQEASVEKSKEKGGQQASPPPAESKFEAKQPWRSRKGDRFS